MTANPTAGRADTEIPVGEHRDRRAENLNR